MILKSMTRRKGNIKQLLDYVFQDHKHSNFVLTHNIFGKTKQAYLKAFEDNEQDRRHIRSNNISVYHEIIAFHFLDKEKISSDTLLTLGKEYIKRRNPNALFVIVPHYDRDSLHLHCVMSGTEIHTGRSSRVSRERFAEIKRELMDYQREQYPQLTHSIVDVAKLKPDQISEKEYQFTKRTAQPSERQQTQEQIQKLFRESKSLTDFYRRIKASQLETYSRNGKITGIQGKRKMRFTTLGIQLEQLIEKENLLHQFQKLREHPNHRQNTRTWDK